MAKGLRFPTNAFCVPDRCIAVDKNGVAWVIDPATGTIEVAKIITEDKKPAVKKKRSTLPFSKRR